MELLSDVSDEGRGWSIGSVTRGVDFDDGWLVGQTGEGFVTPDLLTAPAEHLEAATATPGEVVAGLWEGWGELRRHGAAPYITSASRLLGWWARRATMAEQRGALVDAVLADDRFEAFEVDEKSDLTYEGDVVNPPRTGWPEGP